MYVTTELRVHRKVCLIWTFLHALYGSQVIRVSHPTNVQINLQSNWHMTFLKVDCQLLLLSLLPVQWKWLQRLRWNPGSENGNKKPLVSTRDSWYRKSASRSYFRIVETLAFHIAEYCYTIQCYRTGICESPICDCGNERESVEHFLLRCSKYQSARIIMLDSVNYIRFSSKNRSRFDISEHVLLAPKWNSRVSGKDDRMIKEALFQFISTSDRKP